MGPGLSASGPSRDPAMACGLTHGDVPAAWPTRPSARCPRTDLSFPACTQWLTPPAQDDSHLALVEETWSAEGQGSGLRRQVTPISHLYPGHIWKLEVMLRRGRRRPLRSIPISTGATWTLPQAAVGSRLRPEP